jgi:hypothetical protein
VGRNGQAYGKSRVDSETGCNNFVVKHAERERRDELEHLSIDYVWYQLLMTHVVKVLGMTPYG